MLCYTLNIYFFNIIYAYIHIIIHSYMYIIIKIVYNKTIMTLISIKYLKYLVPVYFFFYNLYNSLFVYKLYYFLMRTNKNDVFFKVFLTYFFLYIYFHTSQVQSATRILFVYAFLTLTIYTIYTIISFPISPFTCLLVYSFPHFSKLLFHLSSSL